MSRTMVDAVRRQLVTGALERHAAADAPLREYHGSMRTDLDAEQAAAVEKSVADVPELVELAVEMEQEIVHLREERQRLISGRTEQDTQILGLRDRLQRATHAQHEGPGVPLIRACLNAACVELRKEFGQPFATSRTPLEPFGGPLATNVALALSRLSQRVTALEIAASRAS